MNKNYNEEKILLETAKILVRQFEKEEIDVFSTNDFICKLTNEKHCTSDYNGNYSSQWGGFLSAHKEALRISKATEKKISPMKWRILKTIVLSVAICFFIACSDGGGSSRSGDGGGQNDGTINWNATNIIIKTENQLRGFTTLVNDGNFFEGKTVTLANDINLNGGEWKPIAFFQGTFNGNDNTISGIYINSSEFAGAWGLFGNIGENGIVKNLGVVNLEISGINNIGGIAGVNSGTVINCYAAGNVKSKNMVDVHGRLVGGGSIGGLVGINWGIIEYCHSSVKITGQDGWSARGLGVLVGDNMGEIKKSYAFGNITITEGTGWVGGFVGINGGSGKITNSYAVGDVIGSENLGQNQWVGSIGGFAGRNDGIIENCYATGNVTGRRIIGIAGWYIGGFTGSHGAVGLLENANIINSYALSTSGQFIGTTSQVNQIVTNSGVRTEAQMKTQSTYSGWNFSDIWNITPNVNNGFPHLR